MENTLNNTISPVSQPITPPADPSQVNAPQQVDPAAQPIAPNPVPADSQSPPQPTTVAPTDSTGVSSDPLLTDKTLPEDLDAQWSNWKCMQCAFVYEGRKALTKCPRCGNDDPDKFSDPS